MRDIFPNRTSEELRDYFPYLLQSYAKSSDPLDSACLNSQIHFLVLGIFEKKGLNLGTLNFFDTLTQDLIKDKAYLHISVVLMRLKKPTLALCSAKKIKDLKMREETLQQVIFKIGRMFSNPGRMKSEEILAIGNEAIKVIAVLSLIHIQSETYIEIAKRLIEYGMSDCAVQIVSQIPISTVKMKVYHHVTMHFICEADQNLICMGKIDQKKFQDLHLLFFNCVNKSISPVKEFEPFLTGDIKTSVRGHIARIHAQLKEK